MLKISKLKERHKYRKRIYSQQCICCGGEFVYSEKLNYFEVDNIIFPLCETCFHIDEDIWKDFSHNKKELFIPIYLFGEDKPIKKYYNKFIKEHTKLLKKKEK